MQVRILCVNIETCLMRKIQLRIGSLASTYFSIDNHPLTIVEADGTSVEPRIVNDIFIAAAQVCLLTIPCNEI